MADSKLRDLPTERTVADLNDRYYVVPPTGGDRYQRFGTLVGQVWLWLGAAIGAGAGKSAPVDADLVPLVDSEASDASRSLTWAAVKGALKTYFDTVYAPRTQPFVVGFSMPGVPTASQFLGVFAAPQNVATLTFLANLAGSSGKSTVAATAQTDIDVRKNATTAANGTSVGTIRFAAGQTVPTFIAASGFTLTGGTDWLTFWAPATPDATLANFGATLYCTR